MHNKVDTSILPCSSLPNNKHFLENKSVKIAGDLTLDYSMQSIT